MHTQAGTKWRTIESEVNHAGWPSVEFASGCAEGTVSLLVAWASQAYLLKFHLVSMALGCSETLYWTLAEEKTRPQAVLTEIENSAMVADCERVRGGPLKHFLISGGDMCCEIIAHEAFDLTRFESEDAARLAVAREYAQ